MLVVVKRFGKGQGRLVLSSGPSPGLLEAAGPGSQGSGAGERQVSFATWTIEDWLVTYAHTTRPNAFVLISLA